MRLEEVIERINLQFNTRDNKHFDEESGVTYDAGLKIQKVGYATNLTIEVIEEATKASVDLILTHHDAWEFIGDLKGKCLELLKKYEISHYFNHLPLDDAEFGTNSSLAEILGLNIVKKVNEENGFMCGVIGEYIEPKRFDSFKRLCEKKLGEKVQAWRFNDRSIKRVHILCGAGHLTTDMAVPIKEDCDLYITGEKILYSVEYAKLNELNFVVGSHTFTEIFGVKGMVERAGLDDLEVIELREEHIEALGFAQL